MTVLRNTEMMLLFFHWFKLPDRVSKVLAGNAHGGPCHADHHGHLVVQLECPVVNIDLIKLEIISKITQKVSHLVVVEVSPNNYSPLVK